MTCSGRSACVYSECHSDMTLNIAQICILKLMSTCHTFVYTKYHTNLYTECHTYMYTESCTDVYTKFHTDMYTKCHTPVLATQTGNPGQHLDPTYWCHDEKVPCDAGHVYRIACYTCSCLCDHHEWHVSAAYFSQAIPQANKSSRQWFIMSPDRICGDGHKLPLVPRNVWNLLVVIDS